MRTFLTTLALVATSFTVVACGDDDGSSSKNTSSSKDTSSAGGAALVSRDSLERELKERDLGGVWAPAYVTGEDISLMLIGRESNPGGAVACLRFESQDDADSAASTLERAAMSSIPQKAGSLESILVSNLGGASERFTYRNLLCGGPAGSGLSSPPSAPGGQSTDEDAPSSTPPASPADSELLAEVRRAAKAA